MALLRNISIFDQQISKFLNKTIVFREFYEISIW